MRERGIMLWRQRTALHSTTEQRLKHTDTTLKREGKKGRTRTIANALKRECARRCLSPGKWTGSGKGGEDEMGDHKRKGGSNKKRRTKMNMDARQAQCSLLE